MRGSTDGGGRRTDDKPKAPVRYLAGMSHDEIAAILGGSTAAARRAAADGLMNLRKQYPDATSKGASR